jgi:hypothetical protein
MRVFETDIFYAGTIFQPCMIGDFFFNPVSYNDAFIAKSDLDQDFDWAYMVEHQENYGYSFGNGLFVDNGDVFFAGKYSNDLLLGGQNLENGGGFIAKYSQEGMLDWLIPYGDFYLSSAFPEGFCGSIERLYVSSERKIMEVNRSDGEIVLTTDLDYDPTEIYFFSGIDQLNACGSIDQEIFLSQLDNTFTDEWLLTCDGNSAYVNVMGTANDQYGFLYVYDYASNTLNYYGQSIHKGRFLARHYGSGGLKWVRNILCEYEIFTENYSIDNVILTDTVNKWVYVVDHINEPMQIPGGPYIFPGDEGSVIILKYHFNGTFLSIIQEDFVGDGFCLGTDHDGNIILSGTFSGSVTIGNTVLTSQDGTWDVFVCKFDEQSNFMWAIKAGGESYE